jgi:hypothetical protein
MALQEVNDADKSMMVPPHVDHCKGSDHEEKNCAVVTNEEGTLHARQTNFSGGKFPVDHSHVLSNILLEGKTNVSSHIHCRS